MATAAQKAVTAGGVLVGIATGVVTNLITDRWSWTMAMAMAVLAAAGIWLALLTQAASRRTRHRIRASRGGRIENSAATGRGGADIKQNATHGGIISGSPVTARGADVYQQTGRHGHITDSPSDMR
ncbi:hypothetical protein SGFS_006930 [Streptomyces graminofaciens]|uniref:Uncharacterized protein n=1 Tax=Streptomyces graminofaciens TaxID=68212 RepID=A0ABM7F0Z4_9ACTN|nr:hypothetical protein [Streptomyces graminofaciens]BBC29399.1 hypothetical protein SGFS_006930 [Streptomyces graminofaciens]